MNQNQSVTNFDLPSLHILLEEIEVALKDAEIHLSEFHEDEEQVALLLDSATVILQLASVFALIDFKGSSQLALVLGECFKNYMIQATTPTPSLSWTFQKALWC